MKWTHRRAAIALAVALAVDPSSSFADTLANGLNLNAGNTRFGRDDAVGSFIDTHNFTLAGTSCLISSMASSAAGGDRAQAWYLGSLAIAPVVPQPSTCALRLGGIGVIGRFVRRRSMR